MGEILLSTIPHESQAKTLPPPTPKLVQYFRVILIVFYETRRERSETFSICSQGNSLLPKCPPTAVFERLVLEDESTKSLWQGEDPTNRVQFLQAFGRIFSRSKRIDQYRNRTSNTNSIRQLHLTFFRQTCRHNIFAMCRAAYAPVRSTFVASFPENAPP